MAETPRTVSLSLWVIVEPRWPRWYGPASRVPEKITHVAVVRILRKAPDADIGGLVIRVNVKLPVTLLAPSATVEVELPEAPDATATAVLDA